jgi:hypothetical protein
MCNSMLSWFPHGHLDRTPVLLCCRSYTYSYIAHTWGDKKYDALKWNLLTFIIACGVVQANPAAQASRQVLRHSCSFSFSAQREFSRTLPQVAAEPIRDMMLGRQVCLPAGMIGKGHHGAILMQNMRIRKLAI